MKNMSRIVALVLSASAGVWLTGCAAELGDASEDTDSAPADVHEGKGITKGHLGGPAGISGISKGMGGGQFEGGMPSKGARTSGSTQVEEHGLGGQVGGQLGGQAGGQVGGQLGGQAGGQVGGQLGGQAGGQVGGQLGGQLGGQAGGQLGGQLGGQAGGQIANEGRFEETQRLGSEGQIEEQGLRHEESAGQVEEGATASSQEGLSSWWGFVGPGYRYGWGGYGYYPGRFFYGGFPYGYGYGYGYPYYGYGGCGYGYGGCW